MQVRRFTSKQRKLSVKNLMQEKKPQPWLLDFFNIKSKFLFKKLQNHIKGKTILDIGTGSGAFAAHLQLNGYEVETVDVKDSSIFNEFPNKIYDGQNLPYQNKQFQTAFLIYVLHHCQDRKRVLQEALRVSERVIFIEDTYRNKLEWLWIALKDSIGNQEYYLHKYNTPAEWQKILKAENCNILFENSYSRFEYYFFYGRYVMFVIEKNHPNNNQSLEISN